ncbi:MAG: transglutaminase-like domain-containing protein [Planctomycetota bacterium]|nr:transglutaminase-like domain-containing protein [Planctomycetota bacterium]
MRISLLLLLVSFPSIGFGQFLDDKNTSSAERLAHQKSVQMQVGVVIHASASPLKGIKCSVPIPMEWPEQQVKVMQEESSPQVRRVSYEMIGDSVKRMVMQIPFVGPGETAKVLVTLECVRHHIVAPEDTDQYAIPTRKQLTPALRKYLGPSPFIETKHSKIRKQAKEFMKNGDNAWSQVEAMYDWVRNHVTYKNGPQKGAYKAFKEKEGDCEELTALFVAFCRVNGIPARTVWIPGHCYPEFYLVDSQGEGQWFPCQAAGTRAFGSMPEYRPILQKGDNFRIPEKSGRQCYVSQQLKIADVPGGSNPKIEWVEKILSN